MTTLRNAQTEADTIAALIRARAGLIWIVTQEHARPLRYTCEAIAAAGSIPRPWTLTSGVTTLDGRPDREFPETVENPDGILDTIKNRSGERNVWILRNFGTFVTGPGTALTLDRLLSLALTLPTQPRSDAQAIVVMSPSAEIPAELAQVTTVIDWPLPDRGEIAALLDATIGSLPESLQASALTAESREAAIDAAVGLSGEEAQSSFARSLVQSRTVDPVLVAAEKRRTLRGSGVEPMDGIDGGFAAVGGLDAFKADALKRKLAFTPEARAYGLPTPKGALLLGVPGCGKTQMARALATELNVPLYKLDLSALRGKYVGQSEAAVRNAFAKLDAVGRCVVLADEIEKALAGSTGEAGDGGVAADALGALLSWMNDRTSEAYVIATANDVSKLPPELIRKGRFDSVWWVGLPEPSERADILAAALRSRGRDGSQVDLVRVAEATHLFSGAEVAACVPDAMFTAFADGGREVTTADLIAAAGTVRPAALRADKRTRPEYAISASSVTENTAAGAAAPVLDL
jgi:hypothetical protein